MEKETHFRTCVIYHNKKSNKKKKTKHFCFYSLVIMTFAIWTVWTPVPKSTECSLKNTSTQKKLKDVFSPKRPATASFSVDSNVTDLKVLCLMEFYLKMLFDFSYQKSHKEFDLLWFHNIYTSLTHHFARCPTCDFGIWAISDKGFWPRRSWWWFAPCCSSQILK